MTLAVVLPTVSFTMALAMAAMRSTAVTLSALRHMRSTTVGPVLLNCPVHTFVASHVFGMS